MKGSKWRADVLHRGLSETLVCASQRTSFFEIESTVFLSPDQEAWTETDQVRMMRDVTAMFDEVKALADRHAELHADRA
jgi:hypothetical protein